MLAYDVIKNCDITQAISIYLNDCADDYELAHREETIAKLYIFWKMICELTPNPSSDDILVASESFDICEGTNIGAGLYKKDDFEEHLQIIQGKKFPAYSKDNSSEELKDIYHSINDWFPEAYDYEWSPWEDILGFTVLKENIERHGADAVAAYLFYEMTFDGWVKEMREERIEGIAGAISGIVRDIEDGDVDKVVDEDIEEFEEDDDEEDDLYETYESNQEVKTEEEIEADWKNTWLEVLRNYEIIFEELKMIYKDRELQNCQKL